MVLSVHSVMLNLIQPCFECALEILKRVQDDGRQEE